MTPAERIIALIEKHGIEYKDFAEMIGVKAQKISEWKSGTTKSYTKYLTEICEVLGVTTDYILNGNSDKPSTPQPDDRWKRYEEQVSELPKSSQERLMKQLQAMIDIEKESHQSQ